MVKGANRERVVFQSAQDPRPAVFLDRDGVINVDFGYTVRVDDLVFTPTAIDGIRLFNEAGFLVIVVTNQSGVARGYYSAADVERFHDAIRSRLTTREAFIDAFYYCPYHPDGSVAPYAREHEDRKPNPGMALRAIRDWSVDIEASVMIGDKQSDMDMAARAGLPGIRVAENVCDLAAEARRFLSRRGRRPVAAPNVG